MYFAVHILTKHGSERPFESGPPNKKEAITQYKILGKKFFSVDFFED